MGRGRGPARPETLSHHSNPVHTVAFLPNSGHVVSGSGDKTIVVCDWAGGQSVRNLRAPNTTHPASFAHDDEANAVAVSPDGGYIASGSDDFTVRLWNAETGQAIGEPLRGHTHIARAVAFSRDGRSVFSASADDTIMIWRVPPQG